MDVNTHRAKRLKNACKAAGLAWLVASSPQNITYTSGGYHSIAQDVSAATQLYTVFCAETGRVRYVASASEVPGLVEHAGLNADILPYGSFHFDFTAQAAPFTQRVQEILSARYPTAAQALAAGVADTGGTVGLDETRVNFAIYADIKQALGGRSLVPAASALMQARMVKHPDEIEELRRSVRMAETSLMEALSCFRPGHTELDLEAAYRRAVVDHGGVPYFFVATAARRAAFVDAVNTAQPIREGDMIRFDFGCIAGGYYSDIGRVAAVGQPELEVAAVYNAVRLGCQKAIQAIRPGIRARDVFDIAVEEARANGAYGYKRHHCGHGIGLEGYDHPSIAPGDDTELEVGMVLCIETPYYKLGWGGVMIENTVAVTETGADFLDSGKQELITLPV